MIDFGLNWSQHGSLIILNLQVGYSVSDSFIRMAKRLFVDGTLQHVVNTI